MLFVAGCAGTLQSAPGGSRESVEAWALAHGFRHQPLKAGFDFFALIRQRGQVAQLSVYIEGDGAPWPTAHRPPADPTPRQAIALALAERDPAPAVAYLGRPCQYLAAADLRGCDPVYWSRERFSETVLVAMDRALDELERRSGARRLRLVGHSGGGVIAALLAQRRADVVSLVTVAAPLAVGEWVRLHGLSPLDGPDPLEQATPPVWQTAWHFAGQRDRVVPPAVGAAFVRRHGGHWRIVADQDHDCCWSRDWPQRLQEIGD